MPVKGRPCSACDVDGPYVTYKYPDRELTFHRECQRIWDEEREKLSPNWDSIPWANSDASREGVTFDHRNHFLLNQSSLPQQPLAKAAFRRLSSARFLTRSSCKLPG